MSKAIAILIDPQGTEWFMAYGPKTNLRDKATRYTNAHVAVKAACAVIFGHPDTFWNSEREHAENTRLQHKGWSYRIEEVPEHDRKREGWSVARYESGSHVYNYLAIGGGFSTDEGKAALWPTRESALKIAQGLVRPQNCLVAVSMY